MSDILNMDFPEIVHFSFKYRGVLFIAVCTPVFSEANSVNYDVSLKGEKEEIYDLTFAINDDFEWKNILPNANVNTEVIEKIAIFLGDQV